MFALRFWAPSEWNDISSSASAQIGEHNTRRLIIRSSMYYGAVAKLFKEREQAMFSFLLFRWLHFFSRSLIESF